MTPDIQDYANYNRIKAAGDFGLLADGQAGTGDPDSTLRQGYYTGGGRNYGKYSNAQVDALIDKQSAEPDLDKRRQMVWQIERYLAEDGGRPIIFHPHAAHCWYPDVKGFTVMVNKSCN